MIHFLKLTPTVAERIWRKNPKRLLVPYWLFDFTKEPVWLRYDHASDAIVYPTATVQMLLEKSAKYLYDKFHQDC